jgi:hypothetical protein
MKKFFLAILTMFFLISFSSCTRSKTIEPVNSEDTSSSNETDNNIPIHEQKTGNITVNTRGNTINNMLAGGKFAVQDKWIYYSDNQKLIKMPIDGRQTDIVKLYQDPKLISSDIQVMGDWIYFSEEHKDKYSEGLGTLKSIKRISSDGTKIENIVDYSMPLWNAAFIVLGDWIYYADHTETELADNSSIISEKIFRTKIDGSKTDTLYSKERTLDYSSYLSLLYIDENNTLYFYISDKSSKDHFGPDITDASYYYYTIDINGSAPKPLFSTIEFYDTNPFLVTLDNKGNTYFTGYTYFNTNIPPTKSDPFKIYYINGPLSSFADGVMPEVLGSAPQPQLYSAEGVRLWSACNQLLAFNEIDKPNPPKLVRYDIEEKNTYTTELDSHDIPLSVYDLQDGYIYYYTYKYPEPFDFEGRQLWRIKPDGTEKENVSWMININ